MPKLVIEYNRTYHRSIKTTLAKVTTSNAKEVWNNFYGKYQTKKKKKPAFKVGDKVRLNKKFRPFKKGYLPGWTEEVFQVRKVVPGILTTYKVQELDDTPLKGTFYAWIMRIKKIGTRFRVHKRRRRWNRHITMSIKGAEQNSSLDLFRIPRTDLSTVKYRYVKIPPQTSSIIPIQVYVERQSDPIDLSRSFFQLDLGFKTTENANLKKE